MTFNRIIVALIVIGLVFLVIALPSMLSRRAAQISDARPPVLRPFSGAAQPVETSVDTRPPVSEAPLLWAIERHANPPTPPIQTAEADDPAPGVDVVAAIVGGVPLPPGVAADDHPGQVSLRVVTSQGATWSQEGICEGTLLRGHGRRWIVTAHHCVEDPYIRIDVYGQGWRGHAYHAWGHSGHGGGSSTGDYAVVRLDRPAPAAAKTARLATDAEVHALAAGTELRVRGRGTTIVGPSGPEANVPSTAPIREATVRLANRGPYFIDVRQATGGPCVGDSGGALISPNTPDVILGVLSGVERAPVSGQPCEPNTPALYASAVGLNRWVHAVVRAAGE